MIKITAHEFKMIRENYHPNYESKEHGDEPGDFYETGKGSDIIYGGEGDDRLEAGEEDTFTIIHDPSIVPDFSDGIDVWVLTNRGGEGDVNSLHGGAGNDTLVGGAGIDYLYGGADDDTLYTGDTLHRKIVDMGGEKHVIYNELEYMFGGQGIDKYYLEGSNSIIVDSDGKGEVHITDGGIDGNSFQVTGAAQYQSYYIFGQHSK